MQETTVWVLFWLVLFFIVPVIIEWSLSTRCLAGGLVVLSAWGSMVIKPPFSPLDEGFRLGLVLIGLGCFSFGAVFSIKEVGRKARVLRWLNLVGLAVSAGYFLLFLSGAIRKFYHGY